MLSILLGIQLVMVAVIALLTVQLPTALTDPSVDLCVVYGSVISLIVSLLKRISFVKNNPKLATTIISIMLSSFGLLGKGGNVGQAVQAITLCILIQLGMAIATHEVLVDPIGKALKKVT